MNKIKFLFGAIHSPKLGTSSPDLERLYQQRIQPLLKLLYAHPEVQPTFYFSGAMIEWLEANHSEYLSALTDMTQQRRVELLGGGYYDPIFPIIPRQDRIGQVEQLTTKLRQTFGRRPRGAWLTNFFWEPEMPSFLNSAGIEFTFLDDSFFERAGMEPTDLLYPAITEDQGKTVVVFPVSGQIQRLFWRVEPQAVIDQIEALADQEGDRIVAVLYDFSIDQLDSDQTFGHFDWLEQFLVCLETAQKRGAIESVLPSRLLKQTGNVNRAYFEAPTLEAVHGALLGEAMGEGPSLLLPGINRLGYFAQKSVRHSLARYPEANLLYAKMQYISSLIGQLRGDKVRKQAARESLWKGQHHAAYWHGPDGGLYQNRYRKAAYTSLIEAERQTREKGVFAPSFVIIDYDFDGQEEILYQGNDLNAYIHCRGGVVFELDYHHHPWNYADSCSRHPEMYHLSAHESEGFDNYARRMFVDHVIDPGLTIGQFRRGDYLELANFVSLNFEPSEVRREDFCTSLVGLGQIVEHDRVVPIRLTKTFCFEKQSMIVSYEFVNLGLDPVSFLVAPEINLSFGSAAVSDLQVYAKESKIKSVEIGPDEHELSDLSEMVFHDLVQRVAISLSSKQACSWWSFPLETTAKTNVGFIREYQASCLVPRWTINLEPGQSGSAQLKLTFSRLPAID